IYAITVKILNFCSRSLACPRAAQYHLWMEGSEDSGPGDERSRGGARWGEATIMRRAPRTKRAWRTWGLETLEGRQLLAGNVTAALVGGVLQIRGDAADNAIEVYRDEDG